MKTLVFAFCFFGSTAALAQSATILDNQAHPVHMNEHVEHASTQPIASEQTLLFQNPFTIGHGERPMWEFASASESQSLGDIARDLKKEHEAARKSESVYVNY